MKHIVALSGGKDSTALALRLMEVEPREYTFICTPTGDELPEMHVHWARLEKLLGQPLVRLTGPYDLDGWIEQWDSLPNARQRWCTRELKLKPAIAYAKANLPATVYVGLRADEEQREGGIYGEEVEQRFPMREWGWSESDVWAYLAERAVSIPPRTDCAKCYDQRLGQWWDLWKFHPDIYADAEEQERVVTERRGRPHTFRSATRDSWPASLAEMRKLFEAGHVPMGRYPARIQIPMFDETPQERCRVCTL